MQHSNKTALVMAGGTGGHIFPGLAVAHALQNKGWTVHWLGGANSMESRIVPKHQLPFSTIAFSGVRGKGIGTLLRLPLRLFAAVWQSYQLLCQVRPHVLVGMGGYITAPAGLAAFLTGTPLVLHEQNSIAGSANKLLAPIAKRILTAFPNVFAHTGTADCATVGKVQWVGNPLRAEFQQQRPPQERMEQRSGRLHILVMGGSLGAQALNQTVPQALALLNDAIRPHVVHQSGEKHVDSLRAAYAQAQVQADVRAFIDEPAAAYAQADLIICRAGASTVTELAAIGAAALFVPFPHAIDDHQTTNAQYLVNSGGGWLCVQHQFTPAWLADFISTINRDDLMHVAQKAYAMKKNQATQYVVAACEELAT